MSNLRTALLLVALILFILAAIPELPTRGVSLVALGLAALTGAMLVG